MTCEDVSSLSSSYKPLFGGLHPYKYALGPLLQWQGVRVRRATPRLPEPPGARSGLALHKGSAKPLRILVIGDSSAAGVGVAHQDHALASQIASHLASKAKRSVPWQLVASIGTTAQSASDLIEAATLHPAAVVIFSLGVNDVLGQTPPRSFVESYRHLLSQVSAQVGAKLILLNGLPPMHIFPRVPQPLRWYLGQYARRLDADLREWSSSLPHVKYVSLHWATNPQELASDGFHPGQHQYQQWARLIALRIAENCDAR